MADSKLGELQASFDIVLGQTASEDESGQLRGVSVDAKSKATVAAHPVRKLVLIKR